MFAVATQVYGYFRPLPDAERLLTIAVLVIGIAQIVVSRPRPDPGPRPMEGTTERDAGREPAQPSPAHESRSG